jgi:hypothetical protein
MQIITKVLDVDTPTINNRIYSKELVEKMISDVQDKINSNRFYVLSDYDGSMYVDLSKIIGQVTELRIEENALVANIKILDLPATSKIQPMIGDLTFHTNIMATLTKGESHDIINNDAKLLYIFASLPR